MRPKRKRPKPPRRSKREEGPRAPFPFPFRGPAKARSTSAVDRALFPCTGFRPDFGSMLDVQTLSGERALTSCRSRDRSGRTAFFKGGVGVVRFQFRQRLTDRVERLGLFFGMIVFVSDWLMGSRRSGFEAEDGRCTSMKSVEERKDDVRVFRDEVEDRVRAAVDTTFVPGISFARSWPTEPSCTEIVFPGGRKRAKRGGDAAQERTVSVSRRKDARSAHAKRSAGSGSSLTC